LVTSNSYKVLNDSIAVNIPVDYYYVRNEVIYKKCVDVDKQVDFVITPLSKNDKSINLSKNWILKECKTDNNIKD